MDKTEIVTFLLVLLSGEQIIAAKTKDVQKCFDYLDYGSGIGCFVCSSIGIKCFVATFYV